MKIPQNVGVDFYQSLISEDELGVVIRAHIYVESSINDFIENSVPSPEKLPRLTYEAKLRLACALGMDEDHFQALKLLGDIRNQFGHNLSAHLSDQKVNELFSKLPESAQTAVMASYAKTRDDHPGAPDFQKLSPKDRFVFLSVGLKMFAVNTAAVAYFRRHDA